MSPRNLMIVVSGRIAATPKQGGATWAVLQYLLGFQRLGHDIFFVEPLPASSLRPLGSPLAASANAAYCAGVMADAGLDGRWALVASGTGETAGACLEDVQRLVRRADVLVNLSGVLAPELAARIPLRIYLDLDPGFTQLWQAVEGIDMHLDGHTHFVTVGLGVGAPGCAVPPCGRDWVTAPQPVVLGQWPVGDRILYDGLTTVANWRSHGSIDHDNVRYGQKAHSLRSFFALPSLTGERFLLALSIHPDEEADLDALRRHRWELLDPAAVAGTPAAYRRFVQGSKAEFGIAKSGYVLSRCGWFSDRSVCYLASGRPVLAQETGFSAYLPTGEGLFSFATPDDVLSSVDALNAGYARHARAARAVAEQHFDSDRVLRRLLTEVGALP